MNYGSLYERIFDVNMNIKNNRGELIIPVNINVLDK